MYLLSHNCYNINLYKRVQIPNCILCLLYTEVLLQTYPSVVIFKIQGLVKCVLSKRYVSPNCYNKGRIWGFKFPKECCVTIWRSLATGLFICSYISRVNKTVFGKEICQPQLLQRLCWIRGFKFLTVCCVTI